MRRRRSGDDELHELSPHRDHLERHPHHAVGSTTFPAKISIDVRYDPLGSGSATPAPPPPSATPATPPVTIGATHTVALCNTVDKRAVVNGSSTAKPDVQRSIDRLRSHHSIVEAKP